MSSSAVLETRKLELSNRFLQPSLYSSFSAFPKKIKKEVRPVNALASEQVKSESVTEPKLFYGETFAVDFLLTHSFKFKRLFKAKLIDRGAVFSFVLTKSVKCLIIFEESQLTNSKVVLAVRRGIPIVSAEYIEDCICENSLLPLTDEYLFNNDVTDNEETGSSLSSELPEESAVLIDGEPSTVISKFNCFSEVDSNCPEFCLENAILTKYRILSLTDVGSAFSSANVVVIELQTIVDWTLSKNKQNQSVWRIEVNSKPKGNNRVYTEFWFPTNQSDALSLYNALIAINISNNGLIDCSPLNCNIDLETLGMGSKLLQKLLYKHYKPNDVLSEFIEDVTRSALEIIFSIMEMPLSKIASTFSLGRLATAETSLLSAKRHLTSDNLDKIDAFAENILDFCRQFPGILVDDVLGELADDSAKNRQLLSKLQTLVQVLRDFLPLLETLGGDCTEKALLHLSVNAISSKICQLNNSHDEYKQLLSIISLDRYKVKNVWKVERFAETGNLSYPGCPSKKQMLFHSSASSNFFGILNRGLLMPRIVVDDLGGTRTDGGNMGAGIYFSPDFTTAAKYSLSSGKPSAIRGSRFMVVSEVAVGKEFPIYRKDTTLTKAPEGYDSCRSVSRTEAGNAETSDFDDTEVCIYDVRQQRICYIVEFSAPGDSKPSKKTVSKAIADEPSLSHQRRCQDTLLQTVTMYDFMGDPALSEEGNNSEEVLQLKTGGLLSKNGTQQIPLKEVHIRSHLLDIVAEVVVFQHYKNTSSTSIEVRYVFPLDELAVVSGFEAYINDRHIVGQIKEKELAHREYREAISKGHGAYLMDQDAFSPDIFQVSVGNLPPSADVIIKITYVTELVINGDDVVFGLPPSALPKAVTEGSAIQGQLQTSVVGSETGAQQSVAASFQAFIDMPYEIRALNINKASVPVRRKMTATKAVIEIGTESTCTNNDLAGLEVRILLAEIHNPRMWVERDQRSSNKYASMVVFYPEFNIQKTKNSSEVILLLDMSNSMQAYWAQTALTVLTIVGRLPSNVTFNIMTFGGSWTELFPISQMASDQTKVAAFEAIKKLSPTMGCTYAAPAVLAAAIGSRPCQMRNIILVSDGQFADWIGLFKQLPDLVRNCSLRLFTIEPPTANASDRHLLRSCANLGGGVFEALREVVIKKDSLLRSINELQTRLGRIMQLITEPAARTVELQWDINDKMCDKVLMSPNLIPSVFNHERVVAFALLPSYCTATTLSATIDTDKSYGGSDYVMTRYLSVSELDIRSTTLVHRLAARAVIRDQDRGLITVDPAVDDDIKKEMQSTIVDLSKQFGIITKFTSFIAVEERDQVHSFKILSDEDQKKLLQQLLIEADVDSLKTLPFEEMKMTKEIMYKSLAKKKKRALLVDEDLELTKLTVARSECYSSKSGSSASLRRSESDERVGGGGNWSNFDETSEERDSESWTEKEEIDDNFGFDLFGDSVAEAAPMKKVVADKYYVEEEDEDEDDDDFGFGLFDDSLAAPTRKAVAAGKRVEEENDEDDDDFGLGAFDGEDLLLCSEEAPAAMLPGAVTYEIASSKKPIPLPSPPPPPLPPPSRPAAHRPQTSVFSKKRDYRESTSSMAAVHADSSSIFGALTSSVAPPQLHYHQLQPPQALLQPQQQQQQQQQPQHPMADTLSRRYLPTSAFSFGGASNGYPAGNNLGLFGSGSSFPRLEVPTVDRPASPTPTPLVRSLNQTVDKSAFLQSGKSKAESIAKVAEPVWPEMLQRPTAPLSTRRDSEKSKRRGRQSRWDFSEKLESNLVMSARAPAIDLSNKVRGFPAESKRNSGPTVTHFRDVLLCEYGSKDEETLLCDSFRADDDDDDEEGETQWIKVGQSKWQKRKQPKKQGLVSIEQPKFGQDIDRSVAYDIAEASIVPEPEPLVLRVSDPSEKQDVSDWTLGVQFSGGYIAPIITNFYKNPVINGTCNLSTLTLSPLIKLVLTKSGKKVPSHIRFYETRIVWEHEVRLSGSFQTAPKRILNINVACKEGYQCHITVTDTLTSSVVANQDVELKPKNIADLPAVISKKFTAQFEIENQIAVDWNLLSQIQNQDGSFDLNGIRNFTVCGTNKVALAVSQYIKSFGIKFDARTEEMSEKLSTTLIMLLGLANASSVVSLEKLYAVNACHWNERMSPLFADSGVSMLSDMQILIQTEDVVGKRVLKNVFDFLRTYVDTCWYVCTALGIGRSWFDFFHSALDMDFGLSLLPLFH